MNKCYKIMIFINILFFFLAIAIGIYLIAFINLIATTGIYVIGRIEADAE